jgi:carboxymethylenebutenolidase
MNETVTFKRPDGKDCSGYLVEPARGQRAPGIVVIQEWWGLNDQIKGVARRLAESGYRALVPDLYRGKVTLDTAEANHLMTGLNFADAAAQDIRGAIQYLKRSSAKAGALGFCMGGALTVLAAAFVKELDVASSWYGFPPESAADVEKIGIPIQLHFAEEDQFFTRANAKALADRLKAGKVTHETFWYAAQHGFGNEANLIGTYDEAATKLAWRRTLDFFRSHLT